MKMFSMKLYPQFMTTQTLWGKLFTNSAFLIANTVVGSVLGFLFWTLSARIYDPTELGLGAAYISAMTLLAKLGEMGLGTTVVRFLPLMKEKQKTFINSCLVTITTSTLFLVVIFIVALSSGYSDMGTLTESTWHITLFIGATLSFRIAEFMDQLYIAFEATNFMLARNLFANLLRIALLIALGQSVGALGLLLAFGAAALVTFGLSAMVFVPQILPSYRVRPEFSWSLLSEKMSYSFANHFAQLLWYTLPLVYPLLVITLLGAEANAYFYVCWMIANILFILPTAISTTTFAFYANRMEMDDRYFWRIMLITFSLLIPVVVIAALLSSVFLNFFGEEYVKAGDGLLILMLVSALPYTINTFIISFYRIRNNIRDMVVVSTLIALLSLLLITVLGATYDLLGIGIGWLMSQLLGMIFALLYRLRQNKRVKHETSIN